MFSRVHIAGVVGIAFSGIALFLVALHPLIAWGSYTNSASSTPVAQAGLALPPTRLIIPTIAVDALIESVGITSAGAMSTPKGPADVAWLSTGPHPGDIGNAVIDGHFGWKDNIPAVFDNLSAIHIGDKIYVEDAEGTTVTFIVRSVRTYGQNANAESVFNSNDGKSHLNLITCEGVWNAATKTYSKRLVIFADKE